MSCWFNCLYRLHIAYLTSFPRTMLPHPEYNSWRLTAKIVGQRCPKQWNTKIVEGEENSASCNILTHTDCSMLVYFSEINITSNFGKFGVAWITVVGFDFLGLCVKISVPLNVLKYWFWNSQVALGTHTIVVVCHCYHQKQQIHCHELKAFTW